MPAPQSVAGGSVKCEEKVYQNAPERQSGGHSALSPSSSTRSPSRARRTSASLIRS